MQAVYTIFVSLIYLVMSTAQAYASTETPKKLEAKEDAIPSNLQKVLTFKESGERAEIKDKEKEIQSIELDNALTRARLEKELADLQADIARLMTEREMMALKWQMEQEKKEKIHKAEMLALNQQKEKLEAEVNIARYKLDKEDQQFHAVATKLDRQVKLLRAEADQLNAKKAWYDAELRNTNYTEAAPMYLKNPLQAGGSLVISDRRIELNGCITPWKADYVTDCIQYFNNKNTDNPIFIVIGSSPGGSVMAGDCILKAMENSQAPVYVVVKSFAASMAAFITTLADKSYAYPNAVILHHQPSVFPLGDKSMRDLKEEQEHLQEWWNRLGGRVAKKMRISLKKLDELLYEKSAKGDWLEFADHAQKLKWVDHTVNGIKESGIRELPRPEDYTEATKAAEDGVICLPPLNSKDFYYLYNPDNLYQMRSPSK